MKRSLFVILSLVATSTASLPAFAQSADKTRAREAYDRGLEAYEQNDLAKAAEAFALADSLAPSAIALQAALDAAIEADDAPLGAELLERSRREPAPPSLAASVTAAHLKFSGRTGKLRVACPKGATCRAKLDDQPIDTDKIVWARTGQHTIVAQVDDKTPPKLNVEIDADQLVELSATNGGIIRGPASGDTEPTDEPDPGRGKRGAPDGGLSPVVFVAGAGLTVMLLGVTTFFALDTASQHDAFAKAGCASASFPSCAGLKSDGESSQSTTNVMLALTGIAAIGTAVVGAAFTNWKGPVVAAYPGGGGATWRVAF